MGVWRLLRLLTRKPAPRIGREDAQRIALREFQRRGSDLKDHEQLLVMEHLSSWEVWRYHGRGGNVVVWIDNQDGRVTDLRVWPM